MVSTHEQVRDALRAVTKKHGNAEATKILRRVGRCFGLSELKPERFGAVIKAAHAAVKGGPSSVDATADQSKPKATNGVDPETWWREAREAQQEGKPAPPLKVEPGSPEQERRLREIRENRERLPK